MIRRLLRAWFPGTAALILLAGCATYNFQYTADPGPAAVLPPWPAARFVVLSDTHLFPAELGVSGPAFTRYLENDRKLLAESEVLLEGAVGQILAEQPDFVLVSGDLTKDGELLAHQRFAAALDRLAAAGIPSYVVPGNHDLNNPHAVRFDGESKTRVPTVTPAEFAALYAAHGYGRALRRDPGSLSYLAEPVPGLWLIALDSALYDDNERLGEPVTAGALSPSRAGWLEQVLLEGRRQGKAMLAMLHHGVVEHYKGQAKYFPEYVLQDGREIADLLAYHGVQLVFTGHYHAHDVTRYEGRRGGRLYDLETGSLVTWPVPFRLVTLSPDGAAYSTRLVEAAPDYARQVASDGVALIATRVMIDLGVPADEAQALSGSIAEAFLAHYAGDERWEGPEAPIRTEGLSFLGGLVVGQRRDLVEELWRDLPPGDREGFIPR